MRYSHWKVKMSDRLLNKNKIKNVDVSPEPDFERLFHETRELCNDHRREIMRLEEQIALKNLLLSEIKAKFCHDLQACFDNGQLTDEKGQALIFLKDALCIAKGLSITET